MKKIHFLLYILIPLVFIGCVQDDDEVAIDVVPAENFVRFVDNVQVIEVDENSGSIVQIPVTTNNFSTEDVEVSFAMSGDIDAFEILSGSTSSLTIPAGTRQAFIELSPIDDAITNDPFRQITITLNGASGASSVIASNASEYLSKTITAIDNECPVDASSFAGTYAVSEVFTSGTNEGLTLADVFGETYQIEISAVADDPTNTKIEFANSAGVNTYITNGIQATLDACPMAVVFDDPVQNIALFADMEIQSASFDDTSFVIQANGPLGNFGPYQFIFTKQ